MKVKNKVGTADLTCNGGCNTWKIHWLNNSGLLNWPVSCCNSNCYKSASLGAHVYESGSHNTVYIAPLCNSCNQIGYEFDVPYNYIFTASNTHKCG